MEAAGAMFCIWCDYPQNMTEQQVVRETADVITAFGSALPGTEEPEPTPEPIPEPTPEPEQGTVADEATGISVKAEGLTRVEVAPVSEEEIPEIQEASKVVAYEITPYAGRRHIPERRKYPCLYRMDGIPQNFMPMCRRRTEPLPRWKVHTRTENSLTQRLTSRSMPWERMRSLWQTNPREWKSTREAAPPLRFPVWISQTVVDSSALDTGIATVDVQAKETVAENNWQLVTNGAAGIVPGEQYLIVSGNSGSQYALTSGGGASAVSISDGKIESAPSGTAFTLVRNGNGYSLQDSNGRYLYPTASRGIFGGWTYELESNQNSAQAVTINGSNSVTISRR